MMRDWQFILSGIEALPNELKAALMLSGWVTLSACVIAMAIRQHARTLQQLAHAQITERAAASLALNEDNWRRVVEQIIADVTHEEVYIASFSAMSAGRNAWIRFVARDGRGYVFAVRPRVANCCGRGRQIKATISPSAKGELHALWAYFMQQSGMAAPIARNVRWYLLPPQMAHRYQRVSPQALALPPVRRNQARFNLWRWLGT